MFIMAMQPKLTSEEQNFNNNDNIFESKSEEQRNQTEVDITQESLSTETRGQVWHETSRPLDQNLTRIALEEVVLKSFENSLFLYRESLQYHLANIDPELIHAFNIQATNLAVARQEHYLSLALAQKNLIENIQLAINTQIELEEKKDNPLIENALKNIVKTIKLLIPLNSDLIDAQARADKEEVARLTPLVKIYEAAYNQQIQIADALKTGNANQAQQLLFNNRDELFEKIETCRTKLEQPNLSKNETYRLTSLMEIYGQQLQCRHEGLKAIVPNQESRALLAETWVEADKFYQRAVNKLTTSRLQPDVEAVVYASLHAAEQMREAARALQQGALHEAAQHKEIARDWKHMADQEPLWYQATRERLFHEVFNDSSPYATLAHQRDLTNKLLTRNAHGKISWKEKQSSDFKKHFSEAIHLLYYCAGIDPTPVINYFKDDDIQSSLMEDLIIMEKRVHAMDQSISALTTVREGHSSEFRDQLSTCWINAKNAYSNLLYSKWKLFYPSTFYRSTLRSWSSNCIEREKRVAEIAVGIAEAYAARHQYYERLTASWSRLMTLHQQIRLDTHNVVQYGISDRVINSISQACQSMEHLIDLHIQMIEALERHDIETANNLDHTLIDLEPTTTSAYTQAKDLIYRSILNSL